MRIRVDHDMLPYLYVGFLYGGSEARHGGTLFGPGKPRKFDVYSASADSVIGPCLLLVDLRLVPRIY